MIRTQYFIDENVLTALLATHLVNRCSKIDIFINAFFQRPWSPTELATYVRTWLEQIVRARSGKLSLRFQIAIGHCHSQSLVLRSSRVSGCSFDEGQSGGERLAPREW